MADQVEHLLERLSGSDWLLLSGLGMLLSRFYEEWMMLSLPARRTFGGTLMLGWALVAVVMLALNVVGKWLAARGSLEQEAAWLQSIATWNPIAPVDLIPLGVTGSPFFILPLVIIGTVIAVKQGAARSALSLLASFFMVELILIIGWNTWNRTRPDLIYDGLFAGEFSSFPSGHVLQVVAVYGFLAFLWIRHTTSRLEQGLALLVFLILITINSWERLALGRHWPTDVLGAIIVGLLWLAVLILAVRRSEAAERA